MVKFERSAFVPWGEEEDNAITTYYPKHGPSWDGWAEVLPYRTNRAIQMRAQRIGVSPPRQRAKEKPSRKQREPKLVKVPDPQERYVMRRMKDGLTPSQIDSEKHWIPGTAVRVMSEKWDRENE